MRKLTLFAVLCFCVLWLLPAPSQATAQDDKTWLLNQINNLRAQQGLHAYVWNSQLGAAAQQQSQYMADTGHISHTQSNGSTPRQRATANGYNGDWIIENIYGGTNAGAGSAWNFWINSPVHYSGLVNRNTNEIGIGVASTGRGTFYTLVFGRGPINPPPAQVVNNPDPAGQAPVAQQPAPNLSSNAPAPTRRPPTKTFTPSPTIPTFTPTITWTWTPEWTPSYTPTDAPSTPTPLQLPTAVAVAMDVSDDSAIEPVVPTTTPIAATTVQASAGGNSNRVRELLPLLLIGQVILIGVGIASVFGRKRFIGR